jgi:hypothetical protein
MIAKIPWITYISINVIYSYMNICDDYDTKNY